MSGPDRLDHRPPGPWFEAPTGMPQAEVPTGKVLLALELCELENGSGVALVPTLQPDPLSASMVAEVPRGAADMVERGGWR